MTISRKAGDVMRIKEGDTVLWRFRRVYVVTLGDGEALVQALYGANRGWRMWAPNAELTFP